MRWQNIANTARQARDATVSAVKPGLPPLPRPEDLPLDVTGLPAQLLSPKEISITELAPELLVQKIAAAEWSSEEVTRAYLRRAALAQQLTNCVVELLPDKALERARQLDAFLQQHGRPIGPLHGLPVSVKEHIPIKGHQCDESFVSLYGTISEDDALIIKILWNAGCVFHARTTEPQSIMHLETSSNLYGVTVNPFNRLLSAGGSSGGEGALLGLRGSCVGLGTDIGGSIRSPAANQGLFGLRPTTCRVPYAGIAGCGSGMEQILGVVGPLSTSLAGISLVMKVVLDSSPWLFDPSLAPIPWRSRDQLRIKDGKPSLKIGVLWDDGVVKPHPPVIRALRDTVSKLKSAPGVEIVEWQPYRHDEAWKIIASLFFADGGAEELDAINRSGEPVLPLTKWIIQENPHCREMSINEVWAATADREAYRSAYAHRWNSTATGIAEDGSLIDPVDVILCPVGPGAAPMLETAKYWGYTSQWNLLDYPALVFPVTKVDPDVDLKDDAYEPRNEDDRFNHDLYEPERYRNAPVGLQLVGRRFEDEKVIEALEYLTRFL